MRVRLAISFGLVASLLFACDGGADDSPASGSGGQAGAGGACASCPPWDVGGLAYMPACCHDSGQCGVELSVSDATFGLKPGCHVLEAPGALDPSCPSFQHLATGSTYPGCCRASTGTCGVLVDKTQNALPDFGCVVLDPAEAGTQPCGAG